MATQKQTTQAGQPSRDWLRFQQNLKNTSFGVRFGKKLFLNPGSITGRDATNALRLLGLEMPPEVRVGVDLAQAFAASSTVVEAYGTYQDAKTAQNLSALSLASGNTLAVFNSIADKNGWIDEKTASMVSVGLNVLRIIGSGGADVTAWIGLAMELGMQSENAKAIAQAQAQQAAFNFYKNEVSKQALALADAQQRLSKGEIGLFSFLAEAADKGNLIFGNAIKGNETLNRIFPGLKFIPILKGEIYAEGSSSTWYGDTKTANYRMSIDTIGEFNEEYARQYIWDQVILPYTQSYFYANDFYKSKGKGSLLGASILACIAGMDRFDDQSKMAFEFEKQFLTPQDLGDSEVFKNYVPEMRDSGFSLIKKAKYTKEQVLFLEDHAMIKELVLDPQVKDTLKEKYSFQTFGIPDTPAQIDWRLIENFIACMDYISLVRHDPGMKGKSVKGLELFDWLPDTEKWEAKLQEVYMTSVARKINQNARANIAHFVGVPQEKLVRVNETGIDQPAIFAVKG